MNKNNNSIYNSLDHINLKKEDEDRLLEKIYSIKNEKTTHPRIMHKKNALVFSLILFLSITGITLYAIYLLRTNTTVTKHTDESDNNVLSFSLNNSDVKINTRSMSLKMIGDCNAILRGQFSNYAKANSAPPGLIEKTFPTIEDAIDYLGYPIYCPVINCDYETITMDIYGNSDGDIKKIMLTIDFHPYSSVNMSAVMYLFTDKYDDNITMDYVTDNTNNSMSVSSMIENSREFLIMCFSNPDPSRTNKIILWQENSVIYELQILYTESEQEKAEAYILEWMNSFK